MIKEFKGGQKVDSSIKPLPFKKKKEPVLIIGNDYYVSFGNNCVYPCTLIEVINEFDMKEVKVEIPMKALSKKGYQTSFGGISHRWTRTRTLYAREIGMTPEEAVRNQV